MKAIATALVTAVLALGLAVPARAAEYRVSDAVWKLSRGAMNTAVGLPGEVVAHTVLATTDRGLDGVPAYLASIVTGVAVGAGWGVLRVGSGLVDVVTFAAPIDDNRPLLEPEFPF